MSVMVRKPVSEAVAVQRLEALCARSERASGDLRRKLQTWGIPADVAEKILDDLRRRRFLDDGRFARSFVHDKLMYDRWGRIKIRMYLKQKQVPSEEIDAALSDIDMETYVGILDRLLRAKARTLSPDLEPRLRREKIARFGIARGFEPQLVFKALRELT